jgi:hypothetical protein
LRRGSACLRGVLAHSLVRADIREEPRRARIGTKRVGHGLATKINEAVVALRVGAIKPVENRPVFNETCVNSSGVERGTKARLHEVLGHIIFVGIIDLPPFLLGALYLKSDPFGDR